MCTIDFFLVIPLFRHFGVCRIGRGNQKNHRRKPWKTISSQPHGFPKNWEPKTASPLALAHPLPSHHHPPTRQGTQSNTKMDRKPGSSHFTLATDGPKSRQGGRGEPREKTKKLHVFRPSTALSYFSCRTSSRFMHFRTAVAVLALNKNVCRVLTIATDFGRACQLQQAEEKLKL